MLPPIQQRRFRFMDGKTTRITAGFDFVPLQQARGRLRRWGPVRELIGLHAQNLIRAKKSRDEPLFHDGHAAEDRHRGRTFSKHLQLLPLDDEIALGRRQRRETQAFALSGVGADPPRIVRGDFADRLRKKPCRSPASAGLFAKELRARDFQARPANF